MKYDELYNIMVNTEERVKRNRFNTFMESFEAGLIKDLNRTYKENDYNYDKLLTNIKAQGIRVFRNSKGEHKLVF